MLVTRLISALFCSSRFETMGWQRGQSALEVTNTGKHHGLSQLAGLETWKPLYTYPSREAS